MSQLNKYMYIILPHLNKLNKYNHFNCIHKRILNPISFNVSNIGYIIQIYITFYLKLGNDYIQSLNDSMYLYVFM